jgi:hypothetical protein
LVARKEEGEDSLRGGARGLRVFFSPMLAGTNFILAILMKRYESARALKKTGGEGFCKGECAKIEMW